MAFDTSLNSPTRKLGEILVEHNVITPGQLGEALEKQAEQGGFIGKILVDERFLDEHTLINFLVKQFKIPHINIVDYTIPEDVLSAIPKEVCLEHSVLPVDKLGRIITLAMVDPLDSKALETVRELVPDKKIKPILCSWRDFDQVTRQAFPDVVKELDEQNKQEDESGEESNEASMESFGLTARPAEKPKKPAPAPVAAAPTGPSLVPQTADQILEMVDDKIQEAVEQAILHIADKVNDAIAAGDGKLPLSGLDMIDKVRQSLREAAEVAGGDLMESTKEALENAKKDGTSLTGQELGYVIQHGIRRGLEDSVGEIATAVAKSLKK